MQSRLLWATVVVSGLSWGAMTLPINTIQPVYAQATEWQLFESSTGAFRVLFPGTPTQQQVADNVQMFLLESGGLGYFVGYIDVPLTADQVSPEEAQGFLTEIASGVVGDGQILLQQPISYGNSPGIEFEYLDTDGNRVRLQTYWIGTRFYQVGVGAESAEPLPTGTNQLFESFEVVGQARQPSTEMPSTENLPAESSPPSTPSSGGDQFLEEAYTLFQQGEYEAAIAPLNQAVTRFRQSGNRSQVGLALSLLGATQTRAGDYEAALENLQEALEIAQQSGDQSTEITTLNNIGHLYVFWGRYDEGRHQFEQALTLAEQLGDRTSQAVLLNNIGDIHHQQSRYAEALNLYQQSLVLRREVNDRAGEATTLNNLSTVYLDQGNYPVSRTGFEQALAITRELGNQALEGTILSNLGLLHDELGDYEQALDFYQQSLSIHQVVGNREREIITQNNIASIYLLQGKIDQARELYEQVIAIARELGNPAIEASAINNIGNLYDDLSDYPQSLSYYQQALEIYTTLGDESGQANTLSNLGATYVDQGQYAKALDVLNQSLSLRQSIGDRPGESITLNNIGKTYEALGQFERSLTYHQQAIAMQTELGIRLQEAISLGNLGVVYIRLDRYAEAQTTLQDSLDLFRNLGLQAEGRTTLGNLGFLYDTQKKYDQALPYYQEALELAQAAGDRINEATMLNNLGLLYSQKSQYQQAERLLNEALAIQREIGDRVGEGVTLTNLGDIRIDADKVNEAIEPLRSAVTLWESIGPGLSDRDKISLFDYDPTKAYRQLQGALVQQNQPEAALEISERGRARAFSELLSARLKGAVNTAQVTANVPDIAELKQIAQAQQATLVEYSVLENIPQPKLYIWVIQPNGTVTLRQVNLPDTPLEELVDTTRSDLGIRGFADAFVANAPQRPTVNTDNLRQLYTLLIEPIADVLPAEPTERVVFIPQGPLFLVPFPALQASDGQYLIQKHTPLTAPSIQVLGLTRELRSRNIATGNPLIVGNPTMPSLTLDPSEQPKPMQPLPGTEQEAEAIGEILQVSPLIGSAATEASIVQQISQARIVHLASHGLLDYGIPEEYGVRDLPGAIALAPGNGEDGLLTSAEIIDLNLKADLVVLSACDTGRGNITGDGVIGLSRAFIGAGVPSVVVSLWQVPDASTAELMTEFYRQLPQTSDKAQALRQAMLVMLEKYPNPLDWAAFTLIGEAE